MQPEVADRAITLDAAFKLHSRPAAPYRIYLDFDGHSAVNTAWKPGVTVVTPPYDAVRTHRRSSHSSASCCRWCLIYTQTGQQLGPCPDKREKHQHTTGSPECQGATCVRTFAHKPLCTPLWHISHTLSQAIVWAVTVPHPVFMTRHHRSPRPTTTTGHRRRSPTSCLSGGRCLRTMPPLMSTSQPRSR